MKRVALVTGAAGFCGGHLMAHLADAGYDLAGLDLVAAGRLKLLSQGRPGLDNIPILRADVTDASQLADILGQVRPDCIFHLAGLTNPRLPYETLHRVNALGTLAVLVATRQVCPEATILVASTSAVYGHSQDATEPIGEERPFKPVNAYAVSKIAMEMIAYQVHAECGLRVIRARAFNLTGPGESEGFVTSAFAAQIARIETGRQSPELRVGDLEAIRDFTDARDAVRAYRLLVEQGEAGAVYNVCSERGTRVGNLLAHLLDLSRKRGISVLPDPARCQPGSVSAQIGSSRRLRATTGWRPTIPLGQTMEDVLNYWRERVDKES